MFKTYYDETRGLAVIGRAFTFGTTCRRDIVRRLMATCDMFHGMTFADALASYRYAEQSGMVEHNDGYVVVCADFS